MEVVALGKPTMRPLEIGSLSTDFRQMTSDPETYDDLKRVIAAEDQSTALVCV